jgi:hypothetical protein
MIYEKPSELKRGPKAVTTARFGCRTRDAADEHLPRPWYWNTALREGGYEANGVISIHVEQELLPAARAALEQVRTAR